MRSRPRLLHGKLRRRKEYGHADIKDRIPSVVEPILAGTVQLLLRGAPEHRKTGKGIEVLRSHFR